MSNMFNLISFISFYLFIILLLNIKNTINKKMLLFQCEYCVKNKSNKNDVNCKEVVKRLKIRKGLKLNRKTITKSLRSEQQIKIKTDLTVKMTHPKEYSC